MRSFSSKFNALFVKEIRLLFRTSESFGSMLFFSFLVLLIFNFAFPPDGSRSAQFICPFVWLATLFGGMLRMSRTFEAEEEGNVFDSLRQIPQIAAPLFLSKFATNFLCLLILEGAAYLLAVLLFNPANPVEYFKITWGAYLLATLGFAFVGTTFAALLASSQRRDLLLPVIVYPILAPVLLGMIHCIDYSTTGGVGLNFAWIQLLIGFDVIYGVASLMVYDAVLRS